MSRWTFGRPREGVRRSAAPGPFGCPKRRTVGMFPVQVGRFRLPGRTPFPRGLFTYPIPRAIPGRPGDPPKVTPKIYTFLTPKDDPKGTPENATNSMCKCREPRRASHFCGNSQLSAGHPFSEILGNLRTVLRGRCGRDFDALRVLGAWHDFRSKSRVLRL